MAGCHSRYWSSVDLPDPNCPICHGSGYREVWGSFCGLCGPAAYNNLMRLQFVRDGITQEWDDMPGIGEGMI